MEKKKRNDVLLILTVVAVALIAFILWMLLRPSGQFVRVSVDGSEIASYSLSKNAEYSIDVLGHNTLVIQDGSAYISEADCPDHLCIKQGRISSGGQSIVCLPNKVVVEIVGGETEWDGISG